LRQPSLGIVSRLVAKSLLSNCYFGLLNAMRKKGRRVSFKGIGQVKALI